MTVDDFRTSLLQTEPPLGLTLALAGLWWDAKGDRNRTHESAQMGEGPESAWVHAYLHRKEGNQGDAAYWYGRALQPVCREPLDAEWLSMVGTLSAQMFCDCEFRSGREESARPHMRIGDFAPFDRKLLRKVFEDERGPISNPFVRATH
jgi:hypothetical protein